MSRVVLVSGGSAGIGEAVCRQATARGWTSVGASRRGTAGPGWHGLSMDVDEDASVADGVAATVDAHGRLDAVVACAGFGVAGPAETTSIEEARAQLETNFWGVVRVVRSALGVLRSQGHGRVIVVSSIGGVVALPFQSYYSASKFAVEGWAEALAWEVAPFGVHVTLVQPGNVATSFTDERRIGGLDGVGESYRGAAERAIGAMERDERKGISADLAARRVVRILEARRPPRRVTVGRPDERVGVWAKRLLPGRLFERAARSSLGC